MVRTIDVHNHLFPREWMDYLERRKTSPWMEKTAGILTLYAYNKASSRITQPGHYDPAERIKDLDRCGIDTQVLSLTIPAVEELPVDEGVKWARKINDYFAEVCDRYRGRFYAFATLPLQDVDESLKEIERAHRELRVKGITMFSNINFKPLSSEEFHPIYAKAEEYKLPIFIHPGVPFTTEVMQKHKLQVGLFGFTLETSLAVASLIVAGVLEKHPGLNIIHSHLGGVVPYLVDRIEDCYRLSTRINEFGTPALPLKPSDYYRRQVYPDTMNPNLPSFKCCLDFVGAGHMVMGTDYAHLIGNWEGAVDYIRSAGLTEEETNMILGGNAARICGIE